MRGKSGFTLVELLVVVSIMAILAAVAMPAYINYVNRSKQGSAASMLLTARLEEEEYYADNLRYATTIQCLPSFAGNAACLTACANCTAVTTNVQYYTFSVSLHAHTAQYYQVSATRNIRANAIPDLLTISSLTAVPAVANTNALHFSVFQWIFE